MIWELCWLDTTKARIKRVLHPEVPIYPHVELTQLPLVGLMGGNTERRTALVRMKIIRPRHKYCYLIGRLSKSQRPWPQIDTGQRLYRRQRPTHRHLNKAKRISPSNHMKVRRRRKLNRIQIKVLKGNQGRRLIRLLMGFTHTIWSLIKTN